MPRKSPAGLAVLPPRAPAACASLTSNERGRAAELSPRRLLSHKRARTVALGPHMRLAFEDRLTIQHQVRTIARAERITDPAALAREFDAYAPLLPDGRSWRATLLLELPDAQQRERELPLLNEAAHQLYVDLPRLSRVMAQANEDQPDRHRGRLSAVHFLRFAWPPAVQQALLGGAAAVLGCEHPRYAWRRLLPAHTLALLRADLAPLPAG